MRVAVVITGLPDNAEYARVRVLVALDEHVCIIIFPSFYMLTLQTCF